MSEKSMECTLIRDLLPLYCDNAVSEESGVIIAEHLTECEECKTEYESLSAVLPTAENEPHTGEKFSRLMKMQRAKKIIAVVLATAVSVAVIIGGWFCLTDLTIVNVPDEDIEVIRVYRFENEQGIKKFFVMYKSPIYSITTSRRCTTTKTGPYDEETGLLTMVINEEKPVLSGSKTEKYMEEICVAEAECIYGDIDVLKFGDKVIWTEEENGDDPVPEYVYYYEELHESGSRQWIVDFEQGFIGGGNNLLGSRYWTIDGGEYLHYEF